MTRWGIVMCACAAAFGAGCKKKADAPASAASAPANVASAADAQLTTLGDRFFDEVYLPFAPSEATGFGFHAYDGRLEDLSATAVRAQVQRLERFRTELAAVNRSALSKAARIDAELLLSNVDAQLFALTKVRAWARDPDVYTSLASRAVFVIMSRAFAPAEARLRSVIAREEQMPRLFEAARANLPAARPPRIFCEIAASQLPGIVRFFEKDVPAAFTQVRDEALLAHFRKANTAVIAMLRAHQKWLAAELMPKCDGDFRLGAALYAEKLRLDEMVTLPLDKLRAVGLADLRRNQARLKAVAAKLDPKKTVEQINAEVTLHHPPPDKLLQTFRDQLGGLRAFIEEKKLATFPSKVPPRLEETPPFARALTFASMDTPGPYETKATEAFFNVTLPEPTWSKAAVAEHMGGFNHGMILSTAIHEAYPGHYLQFLWVQRAPSKIRKLLGAGSNAEGWAHYTEEMMFDEGYGGGDPRLRFGQLLDALLRNARFVVGIAMHTGEMTFEQGVEFFVKEGFQTRANALRETKRGTSDPTYLVYTLGKLQILKLREDYKRMKGAAFTLGDFHDRFLAEGYPPIKLVRRALLGEDGETL